ncbi:MAG: hypothetical protein AABX49_00985 [Nanoarchaeota archaeon]
MEEIQSLSYHQKVLLAAQRVAEINNVNRGYEFYYFGSDLILCPWHNIQGLRVYLPTIRVTCDDIVCRDESLISEIEREICKT